MIRKRHGSSISVRLHPFLRKVIRSLDSASFWERVWPQNCLGLGRVLLPFFDKWVPWTTKSGHWQADVNLMSSMLNFWNAIPIDWIMETSNQAQSHKSLTFRASMNSPAKLWSPNNYQTQSATFRRIEKALKVLKTSFWDAQTGCVDVLTASSKNINDASFCLQFYLFDSQRIFSWISSPNPQLSPLFPTEHHRTLPVQVR